MVKKILIKRKKSSHMKQLHKDKKCPPPPHGKKSPNTKHPHMVDKLFFKVGEGALTLAPFLLASKITFSEHTSSSISFPTLLVVFWKDAVTPCVCFPSIHRTFRNIGTWSGFHQLRTWSTSLVWFIQYKAISSL